MNTELYKRLITPKSPFSGQIIRFYFDNEEATEPSFDDCLQSVAAVFRRYIYNKLNDLT